MGRRVEGCKWMYCFCIVRYPPKFVQKSTQSTLPQEEETELDRFGASDDEASRYWNHPLLLTSILWYCQGAARPKHRARQEKSKLEPYQFNFVGYSNHFPGPSNSFSFTRESKDSAQSVRSPEKYFLVSLLMLQTSSNTQNWTLKLLFLINPYFWQIHTITDDLHHYRFPKPPQVLGRRRDRTPLGAGRWCHGATQRATDGAWGSRNFSIGGGYAKKICTLTI